MDYGMFLKFFMNNLLFSTTIVLTAFIPGWLLYNHVVLRKICLKDALFEKDNLAAWLEFIGAFIFPTLYLAAKAVEGSASANILVDLLVCVSYAVVYIVLLTALRLFSGIIVKFMSSSDQDGKIDFNNEIYMQKNISASLFSIALSVIFTNMIRFLDILPQYFVLSMLKISCVLIFTLLSFIVYCLVLRNKSALFKEIFIDNNAAAGISLLGFILAVETIIANAVILQVEFNYAELLIFSFISLVVFGLLSAVFNVLFPSLVKVDIWKEVYEQNNVGAAIGQSALYIGIANVIVHFLK